MFGWLSLLGPIGKIINGVFEYLNKKQDVDLEKYKVDGKINVEAMWAANQLSIAFKDDTVTKIGKCLVFIPACVWVGLTTWDYIIATKYPWLVWGTVAFPVGSGLAYLPQTILLYLFGSAWLNRKR